MQGPQAKQSHTGQLPADFRYAHFPDTLSLNHQKKKKNSNKMCHLKNCLPLNQPWMISASNKMEARGPSAPLVYAEPASSWRGSRAHFWDGFWGPKNPLKASPTSPTYHRTSLRPCAFLSLHYPITTEKRSAPSSKHPTLIYLYTLMRSLLNLSLFPSSHACLFIANILRTLWMQAPDHESPPRLRVKSRAGCCFLPLRRDNQHLWKERLSKDHHPHVPSSALSFLRGWDKWAAQAGGKGAEDMSILPLSFSLGERKGGPWASS